MMMKGQVRFLFGVLVLAVACSQALAAEREKLKSFFSVGDKPTEVQFVSIGTTYDYSQESTPAGISKKMHGAAKISEATFRISPFSSSELVDSINDMLQGKRTFLKGSLALETRDGPPGYIEWTFEKAWPCRYEGPRFDAENNQFTMLVTIRCEGDFGQGTAPMARFRSASGLKVEWEVVSLRQEAFGLVSELDGGVWRIDPVDFTTGDARMLVNDDSDTMSPVRTRTFRITVPESSALAVVMDRKYPTHDDKGPIRMMATHPDGRTFGMELGGCAIYRRDMTSPGMVTYGLTVDGPVRLFH